MKFLCDRCKTRYSIGDDRVRGKILKIRCKNCQNVITVREGMAPDPDAAAAEPVRTKKATTGAPPAVDERSAPAGGEPAAPAGRAGSARDPGLAANRGGGAAAKARAREPAAAGKDPVGAQPRRGQADAARGQGGEPDTVRNLGARSAQADARGPRGAEGDTIRGPGAAGARGTAESSEGELVNALNAAFASAMASPPPALEEEWYVSVDGEQAGPYSLAEAQRWVGQQPFDAELHCWSEGFDDWLPVDKVSHFRGLRKRPTAPAAPPPLPRVGGGVPRTAIAAPAPAPAEDEPKPLFAATMASLERGAPAMPAGLGLPPPVAPAARSTPPLGSPVAPANPAGRSNGAPGAAPAPVQARPELRSEAKPGAKPAANLGPRLAPGPEARGPVRPVAGSLLPPVHAPIDDPFDLGDLGDSGDAKTQIEAMPFDETSVEPARAPLLADGRATAGRDLRPSAAVTAPHLPASSTLPGTGANPAATAPARSDFGSDDDLHIGEVSRVVKLGDIVRTPRPSERPGTRPGLPGSVGRSAGLAPSLRSTGMIVASVAPTGVQPDEADPGMTMAPVRRSHRRGLIALLIVAGVLVLGVTGAVILFVTYDDETTGGSLGTVRDIDTSRPEDPVTHRPIGSAGPAIPTPAIPGPRTAPRPRPTPPAGGSQVSEAPTGNSLGGDEIEETARKHQDTTQRCYMRAQRGADAILVGDVKKIAVTLTIDREGNVTELQLSDHAADTLGKCLSSMIRGWKFRSSPGGTFRLSLAFAGG